MNLINSIKSFRFATKGLFLVFKENNFQVHLLCTFIVLIAGYFFSLSLASWLWLMSAVFLVFISETINTAIEYLVNLVSPEYNELAGKVKDLSAAAVLLAAIYAFIVGLFIFGPKVAELLT